MKILILAFFLSAGIAGAYAQTNTLPEQNPNRSIEADSMALINNGANRSDSLRSTNNGSQNSTQHQTDPRNEYEAPNGPNPTGKTTAPAKKSAKPRGTTPPSN